MGYSVLLKAMVWIDEHVSKRDWHHYFVDIAAIFGGNLEDLKNALRR
jgi:hypothetical protein